MKVDKMQKKSSVTLAELSLHGHNMSFLLEASADRSALDLATKSIEPLSKIESAIGDKMPKTAAGIRKSINLINGKMSETPGLASSVMSAVGLTSKHKDLIDTITKTEVLKFSILNSMDAVRLLLLSDYNKVDKFYTDQAISLQIIPPPAVPTGVATPVARFGPARTVPFADVKSLGDNYAIYIRETRFMLIGPEAAAPLVTARLDLRGAPPMFARVPTGKLFFVQRDGEGDPAPVDGALKLSFLNIPAAPSPGILNKTVRERERDKKFSTNNVVRDNFKVSTAAAGKIENAFRIFKQKPPDLKPDPSFLAPSTLANEIKDLTLKDFKEMFAAFTENTTSDTGDMSSYDLADTLVLTGLGAITAMFTGTRAPGVPGGGPGSGGAPAGGVAGGSAGSGGGASAAGGSGGGTPGGGTPGGGTPRSQSFDNFIRTTSIVKGATPAERNSNLSNLMGLIDQAAMRRELNRVVGPNFVFTEGSVDRWSQLAGIKEEK